MIMKKIVPGLSIEFGNQIFVKGDRIAVDTVDGNHFEGEIQHIQPYKVNETGETVFGFLLNTSKGDRSLSWELIMQEEVELMKNL